MKKSICFILSLIFILLFPIAASAEKIEDVVIREIHITTEDDLVSLSKDCILDSYSKDLIVYLDNDITLSSPFSPIPTFSGEFYGQKHTISNFSLATNGSNQGFFRFIQKNGTVKDLNINGKVCPESSMCKVGGIAGVNYGTIESCSFDGTVSGLNYVGGISGVNFGIIKSCSTKGKVQGKRFTGGICGLCERYGEVRSSKNYSEINTEITEGGIDIDKINVSNALDTLNLVNVQDKDVTADTGGIAGNNIGIISSCTNEGTVGYPHYGYNVGGISGRQSGYLNDCTNTGHVYGKNDVAGIVGQMEPFLLLKERTTLTDAISSLTSSTELALRRLRDNSSEYNSEIEAATYSLDSAYEAAKQYADETDPAKKQAYLEEMRTEMEYSLMAMKELGPKLQNTVDYATYDFNNVNYSTYTVLNLISAALNGNTVTNIYTDTSKVDDENDTSGRVCNNTNIGIVQGDKYVGGIAGNISIELDFDMEGSLQDIFQDRIDEGIESVQYESKTVCINNINRGKISSKKDYCGGIAGYQDIGTVYNCENYADVDTEKSFCGGIAGRSNAKIQNCYAMCELKGSEYVGGVAGFGRYIKDCATLVKLNNATASFGAIAGYATDFNEDNFGGNKFVSADIGAIDGISYDGLAQAEPYSEFVIDENIPKDMKHLTVTFVADDIVVKTIPFDYNGSISESQIPEVPQKAGYTGKWEDFDKNNLCFSFAVNADYKSNLGAVASKETRDESQLPIIVIDGNFKSSVSLNLYPYKMQNYPTVDSDDLYLESYCLKILCDNKADGSEKSIRFLPPEINDSVYEYRLFILSENGDWIDTEYTKIGSYLEFKSESNTIIFSVYQHKNSSVMFLVVAIASALLLLAVFLLFRKVFNKTRNKITDASNEDNYDNKASECFNNENVAGNNHVNESNCTSGKDNINPYKCNQKVDSELAECEQITSADNAVKKNSIPSDDLKKNFLQPDIHSEEVAGSLPESSDKKVCTDEPELDDF